MSKIRNITIAGLSAGLLLATSNVQAAQTSPGREPARVGEPSSGREPRGESRVPRKMHQEPNPFNCGALLIPCGHGIFRPDQNPQVDPHEPTKPNPKDPGVKKAPPKKPKPAPTPVPQNEPNPNEGPTNKPGSPDEDW